MHAEKGKKQEIGKAMGKK